MAGSDHSVEIDVTLNSDGIVKDFDKLEKKAKSGVKGVVRTVDQITESMEGTQEEAKKTGNTYQQAAEDMEDSARKASAQTENLEYGIRQTREEIDKASNSFSSFGSVAKTAVAGVAVVTGTLFTALAAGSGLVAKTGTEYKRACNDLQTATGATAEEMKGLEEAIKNVYAANFGEDMSEVADAVANVKKNIGGTSEEIEEATKLAIGFRDTFGYEVNENTRAAKALMQNFGVSAQKAYDLMAKGAQNGLDYSGELIDNINEYSVQFKKAGLTAEDMFNIMQSGADSGAWNLDKIGDAVKELNVRLVDGSETTKEGLKAIGLNADDVAKKMSQGGDVARETYQKVVKSLGEMKDKQAQNIAGVNLFGTMWEDLGPEVVAQLAGIDGAYSDVQGTMEQINGIKYDDLQSVLEAVKRKVETSLLLPISEDVLPAISDATNAAIGYIDRLADAYETEGVNGLVEEAGAVFTEIAARAIEEAPRMVDAAAEFIEQMVNGLQENSGKLSEAGAQLVKSLAKAALSILPKELKEPLEEAIDDIVDSLTGGGIKKGLKTFGTMFENSFKIVAKVTKTILPPFVKIVDKTADHLDVLIPLVVAGATAFKGYKIITTVSKNMQALAKITATLTTLEKANALQLLASNSALTAQEFIVGVLTGKITLATAAHAAWNAVKAASTGPVGLVTAGVVTLGAAIAAHCLLTDQDKDKTSELSKAQEELYDRIKEQSEAYQELSEEREKQFREINAEYSNTQALANELKTIVDENGKIKDGYEERANIITGLLSDALGIEIEITDGVIQKYGELEQSIDNVILKKRAEAVQSAMQDSYTEAINNQTEACVQLADAKDNLTEAEDNLHVAEEKYQKLLDDKSPKSKEEAIARYHQMQALETQIEELASAYDKAKTKYEEAEGTYIGYITTIQNYEGVAGAVVSGDALQIEEALARATNSFIDAETGTKEALEQQVEDMTTNYEALKKAIEEGAPGVTQEAVEEAALMVAMSTAEYAKLAPNATEEIAKLEPGVVGTLAKMDMEGKLGEEGKKALNGLLLGLDGLDAGTKEKFELAVKGALQGLENFDEIEKKAKEQGKTFLEIVAESLDIHSPSKAMEEIYSNVNPGAVKGLQKNESKLLDAGQDLIGNFLKVFQNQNLESKGESFGEDFGQGYINGILKKTAGAVETGTQIAQSALSGTQNAQDSHSPAKETQYLGDDYAQGYILSILRKTSDAMQAGAQMGKSSVQALKDNIQTTDTWIDIDSLYRRADAVVSGRIASYLAIPSQILTGSGNNSNKLSEQELEAIGEAVGDVVNERISNMKFVFKERELGRVIEEVSPA